MSELPCTAKARPSFVATLAAHALPLTPLSIETMQINITKLCNQACTHCHVDASPRRREMMSNAVVERCLQILADHPAITTLDITGGAPELHPRFKDIVTAARALKKRVLVRHNLTVTLDPHPISRESLEYLPAFFAQQQVEVISSLPCYEQERTDGQRGDGVFHKSIESLRRLNQVGFGMGGELLLHLVYNPTGTQLPGSQSQLQSLYKQRLAADYDIHFDRLYTITNMPIHRFKAQLRREKSYEAYMDLLASAFTAQAAGAAMCRSMLSVAPDGRLFDCDFNQMLNLPVASEAASVFDFDASTLLSRQVIFADHCFGCTAGAGSSCGGSLSPGGEPSGASN